MSAAFLLQTNCLSVRSVIVGGTGTICFKIDKVERVETP